MGSSNDMFTPLSSLSEADDLTVDGQEREHQRDPANPQSCMFKKLIKIETTQTKSLQEKDDYVKILQDKLRESSIDDPGAKVSLKDDLQEQYEVVEAENYRLIDSNKILEANRHSLDYQCRQLREDCTSTMTKLKQRDEEFLVFKDKFQ